MKRFYRQRKQANNNKSSKSRKKSKDAPVPHQDNHDPKEEMLQKFDMNMAYGPCLGMTRVERLERAQKMGLNPPQEIEKLLKSDTDNIKIQSQCLWNISGYAAVIGSLSISD